MAAAGPRARLVHGREGGSAHRRRGSGGLVRDRVHAEDLVDVVVLDEGAPNAPAPHGLDAGRPRGQGAGGPPRAAFIVLLE